MGYDPLSTQDQPLIPDSGSYTIARPWAIPESTWTAAISGGLSPKEAFESGYSAEMGAYWQIFNALTGSEATFSADYIERRVEEFASESFNSGYNMSGSLLWKDNTAHHPFK
jgi:hypothetical protein